LLLNLFFYTNTSSAGAIHGDFERGFIKAEVVAYDDFHSLCEGGKSMGPIKAAGKYRQEGKTYVRILARHAVEERKRRTADMVK
jgi:ribosome-binding ATPase YchF (GTP1/OBG family)